MKAVFNCLRYIERFLKIRNKAGKVVPLKLNKPQQKLYAVFKQQWDAGKPVRIIILKARQMGFSTLTEAIFFFLTATARMVHTLIVAHTAESTGNLFRMAKLFYDELPPALKPAMLASNAQELEFDKSPRAEGPPGLRSRIRCATAGGSGIGRSFTFQYLHLSEFAFWPGKKMVTFTGLVQAVPDLPETAIVIESTPNGFEEFKKMWDTAVQAQRDGIDGYIPVFFAWFEMEEYRRKPGPDFVRTPEEQELADTFGLDDEQLAWRRWCIAVNCGGDINLFHQEYPATPEEAFISTGSCVFDQAALVLRIEAVRGDKWVRGSFRITKGVDGRILDSRWAEDPKGAIRIRKQPEEYVPYVIGGDTAGVGSDWFVGQVLDNRTGEQVAVLHQQFGEREYAEQMYCLGMHYNKALIGVETNYSTFPEAVLEELGYPKLYVRERYDTFSKTIVNAYGFQTSSKTRPFIIDKLKDVARESLETVTDMQTLQEMLTFVYDENRRPEAVDGEHDDLVMALSIAHGIRNQQSFAAKTPKADRGRKWTEDMWEDYRNATPAVREMLRQKWGNPER